MNNSKGSTTTVDNKVVQMQFDNKNFERNTKQSISTLDKLKQALRLDGATKGLNDVNRASRNNDIGAMGRAADTVSVRFKAMQIAAATAIANLTNTAIQAGTRMTKALTIDPISTGAREYETKMDSIKTILANTAKSGTNLEDVNRALDELNEYSDKTIYNFAQMTDMVGKFSATSGQLDSSVNIVKGMSNLAAEAGVSNTRLQGALYQTSQAMSGAYFQAMDWMSLENAGIATRNFKDDIYDMAVAMGTLTKAQREAIESGKIRFNDSLSDLGWLTTDVFAAVTTNYANDEAMTKAAGEVTTFTKLFSVLTETIQSGWAKSFENIVGNYEEAKELFTGINNYFGDMINASSDARNAVLAEWKDMGGRDDLIAGFQNIGKAIGAIFTPIKEAYREFFPKSTAESLHNATKSFKEFTEGLIINGETAEKIKGIFAGLFGALKGAKNVITSMINFAITIAETLWPIADGILTIFGALGWMISKFAEAGQEGGFLADVLTSIKNALSYLTEKVKEFVDEFLKFDNIIGVLGIFFGFIKEIILAIGRVLGELISGGDLKNVMELFNTGLLGMLIYNLKNAISGFSNFGENINNILLQVKNTLIAFQAEINSRTLKNIATSILILAGALFIMALIPEEKIASTLTMLAVVMAEFLLMFRLFNKVTMSIGKGAKVIRASIAIIALATSMTIMASALKKMGSLNITQTVIGVIGLAGAMSILVAAMHLMPTKKRMISIGTSMIMLSTAMYILASAVRKMSSLNIEDIGRGLIGLGGALSMIVIFFNKLPDNKRIIATSFAMNLMSFSLLTLASAVGKMGDLSWGEITRGLAGMAGALIILTQTMNALDNDKRSLGNSANLILMVNSLVVLAEGMTRLAELSWNDIARSLTAMAGAMAILTISAKIMDGTKGFGMTLAAASIGLLLFAGGLKSLAEMDYPDIVRSLVALTGGILVLVGAAYLLKPVAGTLLLVAGACALFSLAVVGVGAGIIAIAHGILYLGIALSGGATAIVAGLAAIILGILGMVPEIIEIARLAILGLAMALIELAPIVAKALGTLIVEALKMLADYVPMMVTIIFDLLINVIRAVADRVPELLVSIAELIQAIFKGFVQAFETLDPKVFLEGSKALVILTGAFLLMATLAKMAPMAALGVLAFGVLVAELGYVLMGLSYLFGEGAEASIAKAGNIMQAIGTAIGQFIGGIIGGIGTGISGAMPTIANNLSEFMINLQPFIDGLSNVKMDLILKAGILTGAIIALSVANFIAGLAKLISFGGDLATLGKDLSRFMINAQEFIASSNSISPNMIRGVKAITEAIMMLSAASLLDGIAKIFTFGKGGLSKLGEEIVPLGKSMNKFVKSLGNFSDSQVKTIESACDGLVALASASKKIPNEGGVWGWIAGDNSLGKFSGYLPDLGKNLKSFVKELGNFDQAQVTTVESSTEAIKKIAEASKDIPNEGGVWGWLAGDNSLAKFSENLPKIGEDLASFVVKLGTFDEAQVTAADCAGRAISKLAESAQNIPTRDGLWQAIVGEQSLATFSSELPLVGSCLKSFVGNLGKFDNAQVTTVDSAGKALNALAESANKIPSRDGLWQMIAGEQSLATFSTELPLVGSCLKTFVANLGEFSNGQVTTVDSAGKAIKALAESAAQVKPDIWGRIFGENTFSSFAGELPEVASHLNGFVKNLDTFSEEDVVKVDCAGRAIAALGTAAGAVKKSLWDNLSEVFFGENGLDKFASKLGPVATGINNFRTNLGDFSDADVTKVTAGANAIKAFADAGANIPNSGGFFALFTGDNDIETFASKLGPVGTGLGNFIRNIGTFGQAQIDTTNAATTALSTLAEVEDMNTDNVKNNMTGLTDNLASFGTELKSFTTTLKDVDAADVSSAVTKMDSVIEMMKDISQIGGESLDSFVDGLSNVGTNAVDGLVGAFSDADPKDKASEGVKNLISAMITAAENKRADVVDKFKSIFNSAIRIFESPEFKADTEGVGKAFAEGFANGITNNQYLVIDAGSSLGNAAYNAAKKAIDAHSPSRKAYELGDFFGLGFVNGVIQYQNQVYDESYKIGTNASSGLNKGLQSVNNIMSDSMNNGPIIRPVLDLSNIEAGSNSINQMFDDVNFGANLNAISTGMNRKNQNGGNQEMISAINKLSSMERSSNTYNINGITYGADGEISDAISVLLRAANVERRV